MKGHRLITVILIGLVLGLTITMVALNLYPSWSQYARSLHEPLLFGTLSAISSVFLIRSFTHYERLKRLFKTWKEKHFRLEHSNRITGFLFIGVLCTPVTHPDWYIESAHLLFTGLAIASAHSELWFYYKKGIKRNALWAGSMIGILGFLGAFAFKIYSIGMGELIAALPIIIHVLATNKE